MGICLPRVDGQWVLRWDDEDLLVQYGWIVGNSKSKPWSGGLKLPNAWGLFDMHGNVSVLCYDLHGEYATAESEVVDPIGLETVENSERPTRVLRGGAIMFVVPSYARCAARDFVLPDDRQPFHGFRPARTYP